MTAQRQHHSVPTRDPRRRRFALAWPHKVSESKEPSIPNHTSYGFDDNQSKYFQRLEDWIKTYTYRLKELREYTERHDEYNETIRALEERVRELENRADAAGI